MQWTAVATASTTGLTDVSRGAPGSSFVDEFGLSIADFCDDDWDESALGDAVGELVDLGCYALGKLDDPDKVNTSNEHGFLSELQQISFETLENNPETYDWLLDHLSKISDFLGSLDVFPDDLATRVADLAEKARSLADFVPLVATVKGTLDVGCEIHAQLESGEEPKENKYVEFFKYVAMCIVEVLLLVTAVGASYRVAFTTTNWVNQQLVNVVGRSIGWRAYS